MDLAMTSPGGDAMNPTTTSPGDDSQSGGNEGFVNMSPCQTPSQGEPEISPMEREMNVQQMQLGQPVQMTMQMDQLNGQPSECCGIQQHIMPLPFQPVVSGNLLAGFHGFAGAQSFNQVTVQEQGFIGGQTATREGHAICLDTSLPHHDEGHAFQKWTMKTRAKPRPGKRERDELKNARLCQSEKLDEQNGLATADASTVQPSRQTCISRFSFSRWSHRLSWCCVLLLLVFVIKLRKADQQVIELKAQMQLLETKLRDVPAGLETYPNPAEDQGSFVDPKVEKLKERQDGDAEISPLCKSAYGHVPHELQEFLAMHYKSLLSVDVDGSTVLHLAATQGNAPVVAMLLRNDHFAMNDHQDNSGQTALHKAAQFGHAKVTMQLLASKVFTMPNGVDSNGLTALHDAAQFGHAEVTELLLASKAFTMQNHQNELGETALHYTASRGHVSVARLLLNHHRFSARNARNILNLNALHMARIHKHTDLAEFLEGRVEEAGISMWQRFL